MCLYNNDYVMQQHQHPDFFLCPWETANVDDLPIKEDWLVSLITDPAIKKK